MYLVACILLSKNPFFLIVCLFLTSLGIFYFMSEILMTQWFSLLFLLLFLGGLLIMFLYIISLVPKEKYQLNLWWPSVFLLSSLFFPQLGNFNLSTHHLNPAWMFSYTYLMGFTILFLLFTLFTATYLVKSKKGPLRLY